MPEAKTRQKTPYIRPKITKSNGHRHRRTRPQDQERPKTPRTDKGRTNTRPKKERPKKAPTKARKRQRPGPRARAAKSNGTPPGGRAGARRGSYAAKSPATVADGRGPAYILYYYIYYILYIRAHAPTRTHICIRTRLRTRVYARWNCRGTVGDFAEGL